MGWGDEFFGNEAITTCISFQQNFSYIEEGREFLCTSDDSQDGSPDRNDGLEGTGNVRTHQINANNEQKLHVTLPHIVCVCVNSYSMYSGTSE